MQHTILMIAPTSFFADYGAHIRIWQEAKVLQDRGHRLVIATYHNGEDMPDLDIRRSWDVPWLKRAMVGSSRHKLYLDVALSYRALEVALRVRPSIIHAHLHEGALIGAPIKRLLKVPLIFDFQGSMTSEMIDHRFLRGKDSPLYQPLWQLERLINTQADAVITSSDNAANLLLRDFGFPAKRLHTMIDGINTSRFRPFDGSPEWEAERQRLRHELGIPEHRRIVVYLGLLAQYQGINVLLEAAQKLVAEVPNVHFLIMGYPGVDSYRELAEALGIADHVTLPGRILYKDSHAYLSLGDVAVAPKMSATEGSGKIPQYMAMGLPVVTFDTSVSREYLGDIGIYATLGSVSDLTARLHMALDNREWAAERGRIGRSYAERYLSWDHIGPQLEEIYSTALKQQKHARPQGSDKTPTVSEDKEEVVERGV